MLRLQSFKFKVIYHTGEYNTVHSLTRLCQIQIAETFDAEHNSHIQRVVEVTTPKEVVSQIFSESRKELQTAVIKINIGAWEGVHKSLYFPFRYELSTLGLRGNKIIVDTSLRSNILILAHEGNPEKTAMKRKLRAKD